MSKTICSPCGKEFKSDKEYLAHACPKADGANPTQPEYLIRTTTPNFEAISNKAVERGSAKK